MINRLSPELTPSSVDELVLNKAYKDTCVILQILWYNLHLQKMYLIFHMILNLVMFLFLYQKNLFLILHYKVIVYSFIL